MASDEQLEGSDRDYFRSSAVGFRVGIALLTSIVIPLVIDKVTNKSPGWASVVVACAVFTALVSAELLVGVARIRREQTRVAELWETHDRIDAALSNMRKHLRTIDANEQSPNDLFRTHFRQRLVDLEAELALAAQRRKLEVNVNHLKRAQLVLRQFAGASGDEVVMVHLLRENSEFADPIVQQWFQRLFDLTVDGKITRVRRLFLYDDPDQLKSKMSRLLIDFHLLAEHYECRAYAVDDFESAVHDFDVVLEKDDFAIYADRYAFLGKLTDREHRTGTWTNDPEQIRALSGLFEACWENPSVVRPTRTIGRRSVSPAEVFRFASRSQMVDGPGPDPAAGRRHGWRGIMSR